MKCIPHALTLLLCAASLTAQAAEHLIPAGSLIQCTVSEPRLSSKTTAIGDPVLCQVSPMERYGRSMMPYDSYLEGRFEDYKDPGHLVGKGWMELRFDRMVIQPDTVVPIDAKVVYVPGYPVDRDGRIHGKGHPVKDTVEWLIPVLWPIDLINLPRRGPRPVLKGETRLTLKVMDDIQVPATPEPERDPSGLMHRAPATYEPPPQPLVPPPPQPIYYRPAPPPPVYLAPPPPVVILRNGLMFRTVYPVYPPPLR
ncbi:hypothetical protein [Acidipila sp. EB88]|uniref:hypothetical protein n=1 Tax=Acidipila sp. EB88 TaxID=2305226 RepID=UPI000F5FE5E6|nr:hypothetical protein [Acidipila sp. EB88]RRA48610.1 hypothetical protein D1Y84_10230 [Acidipila sp. EB88]